MGRMQRTKGAAGERELARELRRIGFADCRRGQQYSGLEGRDVVGVPGVHAESKRTERLSLYKALGQATEDADTGDVPVVFHRANQKPWVAIVELDLLVPLAFRLLQGLGYDVGSPTGRDEE